MKKKVMETLQMQHIIFNSDNVRADSKKGKRLSRLEDAKSNNFIPEIIRTHREIENFLPNEVWEEILINLCNKNLISSLEEREKINNKIKEALKITDSNSFAKKYIGEFLNDIRNKIGKVSGKFVINESEYEVKSNGNFGTLKNKRILSEIIAQKEFPWEVLKKNKAMERLIPEIYNFIVSK